MFLFIFKIFWTLQNPTENHSITMSTMSTTERVVDFPAINRVDWGDMIRHAHLWETLQDHCSPETSEHGGVAEPFNVKPSQIALFLVKFHAKYSGRTDLRERRRNGFTITAFDAVVNTGEEIAPWFEAWPSCEM